MRWSPHESSQVAHTHQRDSAGHDPITGPAALHTVTASVTTATGTRSHALLTALPLFRAQPNGVANKDLRPLIAELRAAPPDTVTYDL